MKKTKEALTPAEKVCYLEFWDAIFRGVRAFNALVEIKKQKTLAQPKHRAGKRG